MFIKTSCQLSTSCALLELLFTNVTEVQTSKRKRKTRMRKDCKIVSINVAPRPCPGLRGGIIFVFHSGHSLEDYVEEFMNICHQATCDDLIIMEGFWCGLDEDLHFLMPRVDSLLQSDTVHQLPTFQLHCISIATLLIPEPSQKPSNCTDYQPEPTADRASESAAMREPKYEKRTGPAIAPDVKPTSQWTTLSRVSLSCCNGFL